jgi:hypothetical protein
LGACCALFRKLLKSDHTSGKPGKVRVKNGQGKVREIEKVREKIISYVVSCSSSLGYAVACCE